ncbi:D-glycero-beta-D-manno-heptose 1,7-bisphosphate 7-phosphatase [Endothiovibrio diazotrophicus]
MVILDRDGVINYDSDDFIKTPDEWQPLPGSLEAIARLTHAGYRVVVVSNQSGVARGLFDIETLLAIHEKMHKMVGEQGGVIEAVLFCPHGPKENCNCRKPRPGLFRELASRLHMDLTDVPAIGDSLRDLQAARSVGAQPILVLTGKGKRTFEESADELTGIPIFDDLASFADALLMPHLD